MKRKLHLSCLAGSFALLILILDSRTALEGARQAIQLCLTSVIPALYPFLVLSSYVTFVFWGTPTGILTPLGALFRIPRGAESLLIPGFLGGYPMGAQCIQNAAADRSLSREDAVRLLSFCSNAGPAFIFGMAGKMFSSARYAWMIWAVQILSALAVSLLIPGRSAAAELRKPKPLSFPEAAGQAVQSMATICSWVLLFRVLLSFLNRWCFCFVPKWIALLITGFLELTNGCAELGTLPEENVRFLAACAMLAFGGLCVGMQTVSVLDGFPSRSYWMGKILQCLFSLFFGLLFLGMLSPRILLFAGFFLLFSRTLQNRYSNSKRVRV